MFCIKCGAKVNDNAKQCESCGHVIQLKDESQAPPIATVQKKAMPFWFKILAALAVLALIIVVMGILFTESIVEVVDEHLTTLRANDQTKAYYAYTSKNFQETTNLENFKKFLKAHPVFLNVQSTHFSERSIKNNISTIKGTLTTDHNEKIPVEYQLIKEDGKWKILNIQLLSSEEDITFDEAAGTEAAIAVIKEQLNAIALNNLTEAYQQYSSKEYKEATSLAAFNDFIHNYPIFTQHDKIEYSVVGIHPNVAKFTMTFHADNKTVEMEYVLIKEDGNWKIRSTHILEPNVSLLH